MLRSGIATRRHVFRAVFSRKPSQAPSDNLMKKQRMTFPNIAALAPSKSKNRRVQTSSWAGPAVPFKKAKN